LIVWGVLAVLLVQGEFEKGGQKGYYHEFSSSEFLSGVFHTYPEFSACTSSYGTRKIQLFIPRDYESSGKNYPVLYVQNGDTAFYKGGLLSKSLWMAHAISNLRLDNKIEDLIAVAIYAKNVNEEFTHAEFAPGQDCCKVSEYTTFVGCIKNWVDANYRTKPGREDSALIGTAQGALASFYIANTQPQVFGKAACLSSAFWVGYKNLALPSFTRNLASSSLIAATKDTLASKVKPRLYLDYGLTQDRRFHNAILEKKAVESSKEMVTLLQSYGYKTWSTALNSLNWPESSKLKEYNLFVLEDQTGQHDEDSWANRVWIALTYLFPKTAQ